jgi:putative ubiquitin-RnfH superfamily antitoxin RatB of RatAB toxin-antitoxin module
MTMHIRYLGPGDTMERDIELADGATLRDAINAIGIATDHRAAYGIFGKVAALHTVLNDGDRVEQYEPLRADPKAARHQRVDRKGRPGGKF